MRKQFHSPNIRSSHSKHMSPNQSYLNTSSLGNGIPFLSGSTLPKANQDASCYPNIIDIHQFNPTEEESPEQINKSILGKSEGEGTGEKTEMFKVFIRIRPLNQKEIQAATNSKKKIKSLEKLTENSVVLSKQILSMKNYLKSGGTITANNWDERKFVFDQVFDESDNNSSVFNKAVKPPIENLLQGYNSTVFAYGVTGAGKTFTMFGNIYEKKQTGEWIQGMIFHIVQELFKIMRASYENNRNCLYKLRMSYLEIYNEQVRDLLIESSENLLIVEDAEKGVVVPDLTEIDIGDIETVVNLIQIGNLRRTMASTSSNQFSSRSHAIIILGVEKCVFEEGGLSDNTTQQKQVTYAKLSLVDLAGSERAAISTNRGMRLTEGANINRSLLALGNCINILSDNAKKGNFVPYRDSKLTRLLKESLGGNAKTIMIACVTPSSLAYEETLNTLKYALRAKFIEKKVRKNFKNITTNPSQYKDVIRGLQGEIDKLKSQLITERSFHESREGALSYREEQSFIKAQEPELTTLGEIERNFDQKVALEMKEISRKILENLEENVELKKTINDLKEIRDKNLRQHQNKVEQLDRLRSDQKEKKPDVDSLIRDLRVLEESIRSNVQALDAAERQLVNNNESRDKLQKNLISIHELQSKKLVGDLKLACKMLSHERKDLYIQNMEMKKKEEEMLKLNEEKEKRINDLENKLYETQRLINTKINEIHTEIPHIMDFNNQTTTQVSDSLNRNTQITKVVSEQNIKEPTLGRHGGLRNSQLARFHNIIRNNQDFSNSNTSRKNLAGPSSNNFTTSTKFSHRDMNKTYQPENYLNTEEDCEHNTLDEFSNSEHNKYPKDWMMDIKNKSISLSKENKFMKTPTKGCELDSTRCRDTQQNESVYFNDMAEGVESSSCALQNPIICNNNDLSKLLDRKDSSNKMANSCVINRKGNDTFNKLSIISTNSTILVKKPSETNVQKGDFLSKLKKAEEFSHNEIANSQLKKLIYDLVLEYNHNSNIGLTYKEYCCLQDLTVAYLPKLSLHPFLDDSKGFKIKQTTHCMNLLNSTFFNLNSGNKNDRRRSISICRGRNGNNDEEELPDGYITGAQFTAIDLDEQIVKSPRLDGKLRSNKENEPNMEALLKEGNNKNNKTFEKEKQVLVQKLLEGNFRISSQNNNEKREKGKPSQAVQKLIQKQKQNLKEEFEKLGQINSRFLPGKENSNAQESWRFSRELLDGNTRGPRDSGFRSLSPLNNKINTISRK